MGWTSGADLLGCVAELVESYVAKSKRKDMIQDLINLWEDHDCDNWVEAYKYSDTLDKIIDKRFKETE